MPIETLKTYIKEFTHIVHVADIHIRLNKRHDEYKEVFEKLYAEIKQTPETTAICVLGDIVHSKIDLSPECIQVTKDFLVSLSDLRPTILVAGNHDANLTNKNRLDSLSPIVDAVRHPNLHYLSKSGLYTLGDIVFNNYSIFDPAESYIKGNDIPQVYRHQHRHSVVLFHGPINDALTDIGYKVVNKSHPIEMFDNHDIVLLGDIHKLQDLQSYCDVSHKPVVHYCGSLIQQNHGESIENHGVSLWDLREKSYKHIEIPNDFGHFTILINKGKLESDLTNIPKKARLRVQCFESVQSEVKSILAQMKTLSELTEISYVRVENPSVGATNVPSDTEIILNNLTDPTYQSTLLSNHLKEKQGILDQSVIESILKVNTLVYSQIDKDDLVRNIRWKPKRFEWENLFSYGEDNYIDFTKLNDIFGLFARNRSGKSSLFSALTFCMFDKCEREFKAKEILNDQKMTFRCQFNFEIDGVDYFIERIGTSDKKGNVKVDVKFWKEENGEHTNLNAEGRYSTNDVIRDYIGTYEDFVLTTLSVQYGKNVSSFIDMGHAERKDLLSQFLGLSVYDKLHAKSSERLKELTAVMKENKNIDFAAYLNNYNNGLSQAESLFNEENKQTEELKKQEESVRQAVLEETKKLIKIEGDVPPLQTSEDRKTRYNSDLISARNSLTTQEKQIESIKKELVEVEESIKKLEDQNVSKAYKDYQALILQRNTLQSSIDKKKVEVAHKLEKINKAKGYEYDKNCQFCIKNANSIVSDAVLAEKSLETDKEESIKLVGEYKNVKEKISQCESVASLYESYTKMLDKRHKVKTQSDIIVEKINVIKNNIQTYENGIKKEDDNIQLYLKNKDSIEANKVVQSKIGSYNSELNRLTFQIKTKNKSILELNGKVSVFKTQIENIKTKEAQAKIIEEEYKIYDSYVKAVGRDGIPYEIICKTIPNIENEVNSILDQTTDFHAHFETDGKNIVPYIIEDKRRWSMTLASGYEKFVLSLAIRVALINISNLPRPNFLVIDEGFGVIDSENFPSIHTLFSYLKTEFDFILVVSHLDNLKDIVDKHIEIKKDNGFSKINF